MHLPQRLSEDCVRKEYEEEIKSTENREGQRDREREGQWGKVGEQRDREFDEEI